MRSSRGGRVPLSSNSSARPSMPLTRAVRGGVTAEGALSVARFNYGGVKIGPGELAVSVAAGTARLTLHEVHLYEGRGQGTLTLDATGETPALAASLKLAGLSVLPLLADTGGIAWIEGRATLGLELTAHGRSEQQIAETLRGKAQFAVAEGAVAGIDLDRSLRALQRGRLDRLAPRREDRTPFSELSGSFDIADGIAKNQDLKLVSAHLQLTGEGKVELAPRRLDYTLQTKIAGGATDDGAALRIGTIELPLSVKGPLDRPEFAIKGQEGLTGTIKQIGRNLRSREVQDAIKGLIGGDADKRVKPSELIERLLKKE
jgi:AsmA protein